jgi:hypothetical protein
MRTPSRLPHQTLNLLAYFHEIQQGGHATEGDLDAIIPMLQPFQNY